MLGVPVPHIYGMVDVGISHPIHDSRFFTQWSAECAEFRRAPGASQLLFAFEGVHLSADQVI